MEGKGGHQPLKWNKVNRTVNDKTDERTSTHFSHWQSPQ